MGVGEMEGCREGEELCMWGGGGVVGRKMSGGSRRKEMKGKEN